MRFQQDVTPQHFANEIAELMEEIISVIDDIWKISRGNYLSHIVFTNIFDH